jgi:hypothetical protein
VKVEFHHALQDMFGTFLMGGFIQGEDQEVIHIDDKPSFGDEITERVIYKSLKGSRGVGKAKEHDSRFKEAFVSVECCFLLVATLYSDVVVAPSYVKFSEDMCSFEFVNEV